MVAVGELNKLNGRILLVVLLEVGEELFAVAGVDGGRNAISALGEHGEHTMSQFDVSRGWRFASRCLRFG